MDEFTGGFQDLFTQIKKDVITEAFSNWEYTLPSDPEKMLYDFYFLNFGHFETRADEKFNYAIADAKKEVNNALQKHMLRAVRFAIACELRHYEQPSSRKKISERTNKFVNAYSKLRKSAWENQDVWGA